MDEKTKKAQQELESHFMTSLFRGIGKDEKDLMRRQTEALECIAIELVVRHANSQGYLLDKTDLESRAMGIDKVFANVNEAQK